MNLPAGLTMPDPKWNRKELGEYARTKLTVQSALTAWLTGKTCRLAKASHEHGSFMTWCRTYLPWLSGTTLNRYMNLAKNVPNLADVTEQELSDAFRGVHVAKKGKQGEAGPGVVGERIENGNGKAKSKIVRVHKHKIDSDNAVANLVATVELLQDRLNDLKALPEKTRAKLLKQCPAKDVLDLIDEMRQGLEWLVGLLPKNKAKRAA